MNRVILIALIGLLTACGVKEEKASTYVKTVKTTQATAVTDTETIQLSGQVQNTHEINLSFKTAGQIQGIFVKEGDYVQKGQLLAQLDDVDYKLALKASKVQYTQLKDEVSRLQKMYDAKTISVNDYQKATSGLEQLAVKVQADQNNVNYTKLYAPTNGYIQKVNYDPAEMLDAGMSLFSFLDNNQLEVVAQIPAKLYVTRNQFKSFYCSSPYNNEKVKLKLVGYSPKADGNQLYQLTLTFDDPKQQIPSGLNVELEINKENTLHNGTYTLSPHAIFKYEGASYVWVVGNDGCVKRQAVIIDGIDKHGNVYIKYGISSVEQVVAAGVHKLTEGERVKVLAKESETNVGGLL